MASDDLIAGLKDNYTKAWNSVKDVKPKSNTSNNGRNVRGVGNRNINSQRNAYSNIDTAMTILEKLPEFTEYGSSLSYNISYAFTDSPLLALISLLSKIGVTIKDLKEWITDFLIGALPAIEIGVKASLLSNLKGMVACAADPRIPKWMRKQIGEYYFDSLFHKFDDETYRERERGLDIPLNAIDPNRILSKSPYSKEGWQYYYGVKSAERIANFQHDSVVGDVLVTASTPTYKLVRAKDFNAFLWYAIHKSQLASPTHLSINGTSFDYPDGSMSYTIDTSRGGKTLLAQMVAIPQYSPDDENKYDKISLGQTFIVESEGNDMNNVLGICYSKESNKDNVDTADILLPISNDWNSINWYVNKDEYFTNNLGFSYDEPTSHRNEKGLCNIEYINPNYRSEYFSSRAFNGLRFTILPKPYVYIPYVNNGEDLWRVKRILFDDMGNPDSNGRFSLPTDMMTSSGSPYVHNLDMQSANAKKSAYINNPDNVDNINNDWQNLLEEITSSATTHSEEDMAIYVAHQHSEDPDWDVRIAISYQILQGADLEGSNYTEVDRKRAMDVIFNAAGKIAEEKQHGEGSNVRFEVGEEADNCTLFIDKKTGMYKLGKTKEDGIEPNLSKHLIECYNGLTLYEFNYDYVMGLKLFDPSVVAYRLIQSALNMRVTTVLSANLDFDNNEYSFYSSSQRIERLLKKIIESGDEEYTDCFYTFSNDDFIDMLNESELRRYNNLPYENSKTILNIDEVAEILAGISSESTLIEQREAISNAIEKTFAIIAENNNDIAKRDAYKVQFDFATNLLTKLAMILLESLITPKVLMIIAVNRTLMGDDSRMLTTEDLLKGAQGLIIGIIKELRDLIVKKLLDYVLDYLSPMALEVGAKLEVEQYQNYIDLIKSLLALFKGISRTISRINSILSSMSSAFNNANGNYDLPTVLDNVNYADIIESAIENNNNDTPINNC